MKQYEIIWNNGDHDHNPFELGIHFKRPPFDEPPDTKDVSIKRREEQPVHGGWLGSWQNISRSAQYSGKLMEHLQETQVIFSRTSWKWDEMIGGPKASNFCSTWWILMANTPWCHEGRSYFAAGRACDVLKVSEAMGTPMGICPNQQAGYQGCWLQVHCTEKM